jgi:SAM-dependent methyltransferase
MMTEFKSEVRYGFGKNWAEFIERNLNDEIVEDSCTHLARFLRVSTLKNLSFLDIGCGSGLHSLAAHRMGAGYIISFDYDGESVETTERVRRYAGDPLNWTVMQGSVLDRELMERLPPADIVYSWGVLHHTGEMWRAVRNAVIPMKPDGVFYMSLYSSDNYVDPPPEYWIKVKRKYNAAGPIGKRVREWQYVLRFSVLPELKAGRNPLQIIRHYGSRGMNYWTDVKDWLGGYPIEFASFQETQDFGQNELGLDLVNVKTGEGCTEYLFCRLAQNQQWQSIIEHRALTPLEGPYIGQGGASYALALPHLENMADSRADPRRSTLMLYEDGRILGIAHSVHDHIKRYGKGRFSHWDTSLYFSTSDNSDPNTNGRSYSYCERY